MGITRILRVIGSASLTGALVFASAPPATADQVRDDQWALKSLDAESVWEISRGKGQTVAVIDDGVNARHPDLKGNVIEGKDFIDGGSTAPKNGDNHGTGIAGIIAGHGHGLGNRDGVMGLAPEAKVLAIRANASNSLQFDKAVKYAVDHGASVINISQGGGKYSVDDEEAVAYALKKNVPIVASTGNSGKSVEYPAAYPGLVAVGGLEKSNTIWDNSNNGKQTLLSAPAVDIVSTGGPRNLNGYGIGDGTSTATAYVSAAAALVRSKYPKLTAGQVVNRLTKTAEMPDSEKATKLPDDRYGYGALRPLAALQEDVPKGPAYGPLSLPLKIKSDLEEAEKLKESQAQQKEADREFVILWVITGVLALLFVGGIILMILLVRRRRKKKRNVELAGPSPYPYPPGQAPGYGMPHYQQQPDAQQQMSAPPQQPPLN
ncbi:hypothetical protein GCM10012287_48580 [Streptomyces daqingensis]|uniref:Peptidase S8/S53 domain-containing protein n=1 Tax=Streptomyces daqingensis TaxID=1472640 RepID=A0ABQ2MQK9_9ACTN|nr:type VII secretion-associated serine protease mycosin [Streptomyces daqingensis]GGO56003.1 hypothetical protein GCM10012287_48580 [Streptomyces daqingensis]